MIKSPVKLYLVTFKPARYCSLENIMQPNRANKIDKWRVRFGLYHLRHPTNGLSHILRVSIYCDDLVTNSTFDQFVLNLSCRPRISYYHYHRLMFVWS